MAEWLKLLVYALRSRFKSRARLEAENLVLRQQINILIRKLPKRAADEFGPTAVGLAVPAFPVDPERNQNHQTRNGDPLAPLRLSRVLAMEISLRRGTATAGWRDSRSNSTDEHGQPLWGAPRIHGELLMLGIEIASRPWRSTWC